MTVFGFWSQDERDTSQPHLHCPWAGLCPSRAESSAEEWVKGAADTSSQQGLSVGPHPLQLLYLAGEEVGAWEGRGPDQGDVTAR